MGHVVKSNKMLKDPHKVKAIVDAPPPKNVDQLYQFLGLVTYYSQLVPDYLQRTSPLCQLLQKDWVWKWTSSYKSAFIALKNKITSDQVIILYDPSLPVTLACDAGPIGIGAVLSHIVDGKKRSVVIIPCSLPPAELRYSQLNCEALAIVFAVRKLFTYLYS